MARPDPHVHSLSPQVLRTYKQLVQYICSRQLEQGDRLPPQEELRQLLGKNHYTLSAAMQALANQGVVVRKTGIGTMICDPSAIGPVPWSVGVATIEAPVEGELSVFANLAMRVQTRVNRDGCRCLAYSRPASDAFTHLHHFGLLQNDLREEALDALVLLTPLNLPEWGQVREQGIPVLHLPFWEEAPCGVIVDQATFVRKAVHRLAAAGCRTFGLVSVQRPEELPAPRFLSGLEQGLAEVGLPREQAAWFSGRFGQAAGVRVGRELLSRNHEDRPDGLIVLDDYTGCGLTDVLSHAEGYSPQVAVSVHRQLPLQYRIPVHRYAVDIEALVEQTVCLLFEHLYQPQQSERLQLVPGHFIEEPVSHPLLMRSETKEV